MNTQNLIRVLLYSVLMVICVLCINIYAQPKEGEKKTEDAKKEQTEEIAGWRVRDFQPYIKAMKDLEKLNVKYADEKLSMANDEYSKGIDILEDMENEVVKIKEAKKRGKHLNERWFWQEVDRNNSVHRQIYMKKQEAKMKAATYFTKAINNIDELEDNHKEYITKNPAYKRFKIKLFQVYISTQYDLHNFKPCIPLLERYVKIDDVTKEDVWAYKYLSSCYGYMETVLKKYKGATEDEIIQCKQRKNEYILMAVKIKYGVKSPEYKHMKEIVEKDEMKSEMLNEFR
jgi:hypothetical protein